MTKEEISRIADKISFRLLATNQHTDYRWLVELLTSLNK